MRKILSLVLALLASITYAQTWQPLGPDYKYEAGFNFTSSIAELKNDGDSIYLAMTGSYTATNNLYTAVIKKYDGQNWDTVGSYFYKMFSGSFADMVPSITMDHAHAPYVFFADPSATGGGGWKGSVQKYSGTGWTYVGNAGFTDVVAQWGQIKTGKADTLYVLFRDPNSKMTVMKYNGSSWDSVGNTAFASYNSSVSQLAFDTAGIPYVTFLDAQSLNRITVLKYSGSAWAPVGPAGGISTLSASNASMAFDSNTNQLYLCFADAAFGGRTTVMKYEGSSWNVLGTNGFSPSGSTTGYLYVNKTGTPYISLSKSGKSWLTKFNGNTWVNATTNTTFNNSGRPLLTMLNDTVAVIACPSSEFGRLLVEKYDTSWTRLGSYGFTTRGVPQPTELSAVFASNNIPYVAFSDSAYSGRLSLMKYMNGVWVYEGPPGFSSNFVSSVQIQKSHQDTLFFIYKEAGGIRICYYNGSSFVQIPSGLTGQTYPAGTALAIDTAGIPYVVYKDPGNFNIETVKNYLNGGWATVGTVPSTTSAEIQIDGNNNLYILYGTSANNNQLVRWVNNNWQTVGGATNQAQLTIAPDNTPYTTLVSFVQVGSFGGYYTGGLQRILNNNWVQLPGSFGMSGSPGAPSSHLVVTFDTSSVPYVACLSGSSTSLSNYFTAGIYGHNGSNWTRINNNADGWSQEISADGFAFTRSADNHLLSAYKYGSAYALGYQAISKPGPPLVTDTVYYCQDETAVALTAAGQNLKWYTSLTGSPSLSPPVPATNTAGIFKYYVTQSVSIWESDKDSITVIVRPAPVPVIIDNGSYLQSSGPFLSYQWYYNNNAVNGATTDTLTPFAFGGYTVGVTDTNGCAGKSSPLFITGIKAIADRLTLSVYPNPLHGDRLLLATSNLPAGTYSIRIFNTAGQQVYAFVHDHHDKTAQISIAINKEIPAGVYYLKLSGQDQQYAAVFVKE